MSVDARNRLQPSLLDRLTDERRAERVEGELDRVMSKPRFRQAVLRDLGTLFNAVQPLSRHETLAYPLLSTCVLNFGMPPMTGELASKLDVSDVVTAIREAILRFEPRVMPGTLRVRALESDSALDTHNVIELEIRGHLWSQPLPIEILLRTQLDLEAGQVQVRDAARAPLQQPGQRP